MKKQTAVEWLVEQIYATPEGPTPAQLDKILRQAKEMEKKQIINAYIADFTFVGRISDAEQYYKETYEQE